jgi:hypothetical protein
MGKKNKKKQTNNTTMSEQLQKVVQADSHYWLNTYTFN